MSNPPPSKHIMQIIINKAQIHSGLFQTFLSADEGEIQKDSVISAALVSFIFL